MGLYSSLAIPFGKCLFTFIRWLTDLGFGRPISDMAIWILVLCRTTVDQNLGLAPP